MMHGELAIAIAGGMTAKSIGHGRQPRALPCVTLLRRRRLQLPSESQHCKGWWRLMSNSVGALEPGEM